MTQSGQSPGGTAWEKTALDGLSVFFYLSLFFRRKVTKRIARIKMHLLVG
jgi:hypothetical protein